MENKYPLLEINLEHLVSNVSSVTSRCKKLGIEVTGVFKGASGNVKVAEAFLIGGCKSIASSRINELAKVKEAGLKGKLVLIRIPMIDEAYDVVNICDGSLQSDLKVIEAFNIEAKKLNKVHNVILMADMGDLREGYWDKDEMVEDAYFIEKNLDNIHLMGVGMNVGCYGSILPTKENLSELVNISKRIEEKIGRKLEIISGGASSSYMRVMDLDVPEGINHLRIGEEILLGRDLDIFYNHKDPNVYQDVFTLKAEVIEVKRKPTHPKGVIAVDAFGNKQSYVDRGMRDRALLALGKADYAYLEDLIIEEEGIEIIGASSDHTIIDIEEAKRDIKVGDIITIKPCYSTLLFLTHSENVKYKYI